MSDTSWDLAVKLNPQLTILSKMSSNGKRRKKEKLATIYQVIMTQTVPVIKSNCKRKEGRKSARRTTSSTE